MLGALPYSALCCLHSSKPVDVWEQPQLRLQLKQQSPMLSTTPATAPALRELQPLRHRPRKVDKAGMAATEEMAAARSRLITPIRTATTASATVAMMARQTASVSYTHLTL